MGTSNVKSPAGEAIIVFHIAYPLCLLLYFLVGYGIGVSKLQRTADVDGPKRNQSTLIRALLGFILLSYAGEAIAGFVQDLRSSTAKTPWDHNTYIFFSILCWGLQILVLRGYELSIRHPFLATWGVAFVTESALAILALVDHPLTDPTAYARFSLQAVRILALGLVITLPLLVWRRQRPRVLDEESSPLLGGNNGIQDTDFSDRYIEHDASQPVGYGTVEPQQATNGHAGLAQGSATSEDVEGGTKAQDKTSEGGKSKGPGSWLEFANRFKVLLPHLKLSMQSWPNLFGIGTCILAGRFLSVLVPRQLGIVTDALVAKNDSAAWLEVSFYLLYRFLESSSIIEDIRQACWDPISMGTKERVDVAALDHALHLSADYHENKRTGQLFKAVGQGSNVTALLEFSLFGLGPLLLDMVIAVGYLYILFGPYMGLIAAIMAVTYFLASSRLGSALDDKWKKYLDRCETTWDTVFGAIAQWYTISIFNRADYETQRYREALEAQRVAKLEHRWSARWVGAVQSLALTGGLCAACYLAVYQVLQGSQPLGNFVILLSYWSRASSSFEAVGSRIRSIMDHIIDIEHLLNLLETEPTVQEKEDAEQLRLRDGGVRFEDVCFAHDSRQSIIKHMSFEAKAGSKVAIVGSTGAGKSTVLKLLLRVRDVGQGSIKIDGQDIRDVTIQSLRDQVAVVPQNPTLFNESIMYNVRYGRLDATDDDVFDACKSAAIHEKVVSFPDGYNTKVGELAAKLSGGELQRLSIARAILKNPKILVLDEATSMIDSLTERRMQESLDELSKGRTCFVVAHRLSTIANADMILVVERGKIVEQGRHEELAGNHGPFYKFWSTQSVSSRSGSVAESKKSDGERVVVERVDKAVQSPDIHPSAHIVTVDRAVQTVDTHYEVQASNESTAEREASGAVRPLIEKVDRAIQSAETHHEARGSNKATTGQKSSGAVHSSIEKVDRAVQSVDTNDEARGSNKATTEQESSAAVGPLIEKVDRAVQSMNTHGEAKTSNGSTTDRESPGGTRPLIEKVDRGVQSMDIRDEAKTSNESTTVREPSGGTRPFIEKIETVDEVVQGMDTHDEAKMPNESTAVQEPSGDTRPSMEKVDEVVQSTDPHHEEMATKEPSTESRRSGGADAAPENVDNEMPRVDDPPDAVATNVPNAEATREEQDEGISNAKPETSNPETSNADTAAETSVEQELKADSKSRKTESKRNSQDVAWNPGAPDFVPKNQARPGSTPYRATLHDLQSNGISGEFYRYATFIQPSKAEALPHQTNLGAAAPADKQDEASPSTTPATQTDLGAATPANEQDEASPSAAPDMQKAAATRAPETGTETPNPLSSSSDKGNREGSEKKARKKKKKRQRHRGRKARPAQKSSEESTSSSNVPGLVQDKGASLADHHEPRESHPGQEAVEATHNGDNASGTRKGKKVRFHGDEHDGSADVEEAGGSYEVPVPKVFFRPPSPKPDDHAQSTSAGGKTPSAHSARPTPIARFRSRRWRFRKPGGHKPGGHKRGGSDNPVASGSGPANGSDDTF